MRYEAGGVVSVVKLMEVPEFRGCKHPAKAVVECGSEPSVGGSSVPADPAMSITKNETHSIADKTQTPSLLLFQHKHKTCFETSHLLPWQMSLWAKNQNWSASFFSCTEEITEGIQNFLPERSSLGSWISSSTLYIKETATTFSVECCANNSAGSTCEKSFINLSGTTSQCFSTGFRN